MNTVRPCGQEPSPAKTYQVLPSGGTAARGTLLLMFGRVSFFALGYLVSVIIARGLGPAEYGIYGVILSVLVWLEQIGRFGIPEAIMKLVPEDETRGPLLENTALTLLTTLFFGLFAVAWLSAPTLAAFLQIPDATHLVRVAILDIPVSGTYFACQGILAGRRNFRAVSGFLVVYALTKLVAILIAWLVGLSILSALIVNLTGTVGALVYSGVRVGARTFQPSFAVAKIVLALALPIGCYLLILQLLFNIDLWALQVIGTERSEVIGAYVAALNIARLPALAFAVVNVVILPSLSMALGKHDMAMAQRYVQSGTRFLWITLLPSCTVLALTAGPLMVLLYSQQYALGAVFLKMQVFAFGLFGVAQVFSEMLIAGGNPYLVAGVLLGHIPAAVLLNWALISYSGATGASAALLITACGSAAFMGFLVFKRFGLLLRGSTVVKVLLATAAMALLTMQLTIDGVWLIPLYVVLLALYGVLLVVLREVTWHEVQLVLGSRARHVWRSPPPDQTDRNPDKVT
jgi:O-antigen/teichoic acid export membrane protein